MYLWKEAGQGSTGSFQGMIYPPSTRTLEDIDAKSLISNGILYWKKKKRERDQSWMMWTGPETQKWTKRCLRISPAAITTHTHILFRSTTLSGKLKCFSQNKGQGILMSENTENHQ